MHKNLKVLAWTLTAVVAIASSTFAMAMPIPAPESSIVIDNYKGDEIIRYSVPIIRGTIVDPTIKDLDVINLNLDPKDPNYKIKAQVLNGKFKGITYLKKGLNQIALKTANDQKVITINYKPQTNPYKVRMVYFTDKTGNTTYETPDPNDNQDYRSKFDTGLKLMQSFTAERMHDLGYGRKTFNFEADKDGIANVYVVTGKLSEAEYSYMPRHLLYRAIKSDIEAALPKDNIINLATVAFSKHDTNTQQNTAYTALGGGNLALFGGAIMYTWPNSLSNAQDRLMDATPIDVLRYAHDDKSRQAYWSTASTTLGAALHEMGHAFGLPHTTDPIDIMTRGLDLFSRAFVLQDAPSAKNGGKYVTFGENEVAYWTPVSAAALAPTRSFALDAKKYCPTNTIEIVYDEKSNKVNIKSDFGIAYVAYEKSGAAVDHILSGTGKVFPKEMTLDMSEISKALPLLDKIQIRVRDTNGDMRILRIEKAKTTWKAAKFRRGW